MQISRVGRGRAGLLSNETRLGGFKSANLVPFSRAVSREFSWCLGKNECGCVCCWLLLLFFALNSAIDANNCHCVMGGVIGNRTAKFMHARGELYVLDLPWVSGPLFCVGV